MTRAIAAAWTLSLGVDVFLHSDLLARLYVEPSPFLLGPENAFRRIPLGYFAFLVLTAALAWLLRRLDVQTAGRGFRFRLATGAVVWSALALGLYSITTASMALLAAWWVGQAIELALAGAVLGAAAGGAPTRRLWTIVGIVVLACFAATVALQSLGLAPAMRVER